jgi:hypothetical protein
MSVELFLSYDEHLDWLTLIEFGQVENAQPRDHWRGVSKFFWAPLAVPRRSRDRAQDSRLLDIRSRRPGGLGNMGWPTVRRSRA